MSPIVETTTSGTIAGLKILGYTTLIAVFEYFNIPTLQLGLLGILMIIDFIAGLMKQYAIGKSDITSHKAWLGAIKKIGTLIIILSLGILFKAYELDGGAYIKGVLAVFIGAEVYSIIQNIYAVRTGKLLPEYDVISKLIKLIGDKIISLIEQYLSKIK